MIKKIGLPLLIVLFIVVLVSTVISTKESRQEKALEKDLKAQEEIMKIHTFDQFTLTDFGAYVMSTDCYDTLFLYTSEDKSQITHFTLKY